MGIKPYLLVFGSLVVLPLQQVISRICSTMIPVGDESSSSSSMMIADTKEYNLAFTAGGDSRLVLQGTMMEQRNLVLQT